MGYPFGNDPSKVENYKKFWNRQPVDRPLTGFSFKTWFSILEYSATRKWRTNEWLTPDMVLPENFLEDQEKLLKEGEVLDDDILRGACPLQGIRWFPAFLGFDLQILGESISSRDKCLSWEEIDNLKLDFNTPWFQKYIEFTQVLVKHAKGRYPVSHGTLVGPSDMGAILRGHTQMAYDLFDSPEQTAAMFQKMGRFFCRILEEQRKHIPLFQSGYFDAQYQLWAPEPTIRLQEDNAFLFSPQLYRKFLQPADREMAASYPCSFIHLHSTSMYLLDAFLEIEEIRAFQMNIEPFNIPCKGMIPYFRQVQQAERPLLIRGSFEPDELKLVLDSLDPAGLYLYIMVRDEKEADILKKILL
ncbi:MAG: hypothetical protein JRH18_15760 [Deltaproteobacteria bacterium]|nr:hypothetical protein [Deltaproteobacteria bacterium]MBW1993267.1 hypothetical protein [Deltaproteobacteria bacterium]MBW2153111.1 hypothetical protein [Deltaproteobacteria bacterium]